VPAVQEGVGGTERKIMTNLIGAALVIMSMNCYTNYETNSIRISCEEAECTNWYMGEIQVETEAAYVDEGCYPVWYKDEHSYGTSHIKNCECRDAVYRTETTHFCMVWHTKPLVYPTEVITETVIGAGVPLYKIVKCVPCELPEERGNACTVSTVVYQRTGTYITGVD
jgi:hypothetical protein